MTLKIAAWVLRVAGFGEFLGHGILALQGKPAWVEWFNTLFGIGAPTAIQILYAIGIADIIVAFIILVRPVSIVLLWAAFWGFSTALVRPFVGEPIWDFVERWPNWGAPLALFLIKGWFKHFK